MDGSFSQVRPQEGLKSAGEVEIAPDATPGRALQAVARACAGHIESSRTWLERDRAPEALHQVRVALRRWRAALSILGGRLPDRGDAIRSELKWLAGELDEARDLDVLAEALCSPAPPGASATGMTALKAALETAKAGAYDRAAAALASERARRLLWDGAHLADAQGLGLPDQGPSAKALVSAALSRRRRSLVRTGARLRRLSPEDQHQLRLKAKKARYAAELFGGMFGRPGRRKRFAKALKDLQTTLGELNDIQVGRELAARLAAQSGAPEAGFAAGLILGGRMGGRGRLTARAERAYERFAEAEPFW